MSMFAWRSPLLDARRQVQQRGAIRPQQDSGLAPSPTAPFGEMLDAQGRPALPSLGPQDPFVFDLAVARLRRRDPGFDPAALAQQAAQAMLAVERAWSTLDPQPSRAFMAPSLWASHRARMELYQIHGRRNVVDPVHVESARAVAVEQDSGRDRVTVRIRASSTDYDVDASGTVLRGDTAVHTWEADWTLERAATATSRPDGGVLGGRCPFCGAPLQLDGEGLCSYCHAAATDATRDWVVVSVADAGREDDVMRAVLGIRSGVRSDDMDMQPADVVVSIEAEDAPDAARVPGPPAVDVLAPLRLYDANVDAAEITTAARTAFVALRAAWGAMDVAPARPVMTSSGADALSSAISALRNAGLRRISDDPLVEVATIVSADGDGEWLSALVRVVATTVDADVDASGALQRGTRETRRLGGALPLRRRLARSGETSRCPRCGAPLHASVTGVCDFCRAAVAGGGGDWLLDSVPELAEVRTAPFPPAALPATPAATSAPSPSPIDPLRARDGAASEAELLARARECFYAVEGALAKRAPDAAATCVSADFLAAMRAEAARLAAAHQHRVLAFVDIEGAQLLSTASSGEGGDRAAVRIEVSGEDCVVDDASGAAVSGSTAQRRWSEDWTLVRSGPGDPWVVGEVAGPASS